MEPSKDPRQPGTAYPLAAFGVKAEPFADLAAEADADRDETLRQLFDVGRRAHLTLAFSDGCQAGPYVTPEQQAGRERAQALYQRLREVPERPYPCLAPEPDLEAELEAE